MANDNTQSEMQSCCGQAVEECFCGNNSFVRAEEVCGIVEPKLQELKDYLDERLKEFQECLIKEVCIVGKDGCTTNLAVTDSSMAARDPQNLSAGMKITLTSDSINEKLNPAIGNYVPVGSPVPPGETLLGVTDKITFDNSQGCKELCGTVHVITRIEADIPDGAQLNNCTILTTDGSVPSLPVTPDNKYANSYYAPSGSSLSGDRNIVQNAPICVPAGAVVEWQFGVVANVTGVNPQDVNVISYSYNITSDLS